MIDSHSEKNKNLTLREWLFFNRKKACEIARELGVTAHYISMIRTGRRKPSLSLLKGIRKITKGQVQTFEDLIDEK